MGVCNTEKIDLTYRYTAQFKGPLPLLDPNPQKSISYVNNTLTKKARKDVGPA